MKKMLMIALCMVLVPMLFAANTTTEDIAEKSNVFVESGIRARIIPEGTVDLEKLLRQEDSLYFYINDPTLNGVGLTAGGIWEGGIRLTPTELAPYAGWQIVALIWYHYDGSSPIGQVKVYDNGTATLPGPVITTEPYSGSVVGWERVDLASPVPITGTGDLWCLVEVNHGAGFFPLGCDAGPAIDGKGDWIYMGGVWEELQNYGLDYNWGFIAMVAEGGGPAVSILFVDDDAGDALETYWEASFANNSYAYDKWTVADSGGTTPNASQMGAYDIVVWTTGEDYSSTLTPTDTVEIGTYLAGGGAMWLASQDVLWDIDPVSWMHVSSYTTDIGCTQATGIGPIMTGASYATTGGAMYDYSDQMTGDGMTWVEMQNQTPVNNTIAMDPSSGTAYKLFFNAFGFENINDVADRDDMMYRVIEWLKPSGGEVHDVGSFAFLSPGTQVAPANYDVIGVTRNYGDFEETYDVHCVVTDPTFATVLDTTINVTTDVDENDTLTFGNIEFVDGYTYDLVMATLLSGDENPGNDTLEQSTFVTSWFWESWAAIDQGRSGPYAGFWNIDGQSYVYYWGGNPGPLATGFKYDGSGWTAVASMPVGSSYGGDASVDGKVYLISAWTGQNGMLTIFDCESETFSSGTNLPTPVADPANAVYMDNYIYCIGGSNPPGWAGSTIVQVYDIASDTWLTGVTQLPGASLVSTAEAGYIGNDTIIVSGGYDTGATNKTTMGAINPANPAEVTWSTGTPHPGVAAYRNFGGAWHNDAGDYWFMVAGGSPYVNQAAIYQSNAGWITAPNKITACSNSGAVVGPWESLTDDAEIWLYTIAGYTGAYLNIFEVFHTGAWTGIMEQPDDNITVFDFSARTINPVKDQVRFTLSMPYQGEVSFQVFDVTGRQVIDTRYSSISQGEHTLFWNLKDAQQRNVAAGTYFYRFQTDTHTATGKLVVVR